MKRMGPILSALALVLCLCLSPVWASERILFTAPDLVGEPGEELTFTLRVEGNDRAMAGCKLVLQCDTSVLVPVLNEEEEPDLAVTIGRDFSMGNVTGHWEPGSMKVAWWAFGTALNWNGDLLSVRFRVAGDAKPGVYSVTVRYDEGDVVDNGGVWLSASCHSGSVTVPGRYTGPGDVNGDTRQDVTDLACLYDYLSMGRNTGLLSSEADLFRASDVNGDGTVNILDFQALYSKLKTG